MGPSINDAIFCEAKPEANKKKARETAKRILNFFQDEV